MRIHKKLDPDPVGQFKKMKIVEMVHKSIFVLMILEKINETRLKFFQESVMILWNIGGYEKAREKTAYNQLKKLKPAAETIVE